MNDALFYLVPAAIFAISLRWNLSNKRKRSQDHATALKEAKEAGLTEPPSLHPVVDLGICVGSGACVRACPEQALGVIDGKGTVINPAFCIGHGACAAACPVEAIKLVFGTATRGMEIPEVNPEFESNVRGVFIAGELGGMGLISKAVEQGRQAIAAIAKRASGQADLDLVIIGAGPAGISASLHAHEQKLRYVTIEQEDSLGGTTYRYPRRKVVVTTPFTLPFVGEINVQEISKESLNEIWQKIYREAKPNIRFGEQMEGIERDGDLFVVKSNLGSYRTANVLLSIGRRGSPRKLGVPGENLPKVVYKLIEAEQYRGAHVLIVGGGDSALEAALDIAEQPGTTVTLSYRRNAFNRVKKNNRSRLDDAIANQRVKVFLESNVAEVLEKEVVLSIDGNKQKIINDAVIVCAGGELPSAFLKEIGIKVAMHYGT